MSLSNEKLLQVADAADTAIGMGGGVIIVRNQDEREAVDKELKALSARAHTTGIYEATKIVVVPAERRIHWRKTYVGLC